MSDDTTNRGQPDRSRINPEQEHERRYWAKRFNVSEEELRAAIQAVGNSVANVMAYLKGKPQAR